MYKKYALIVFAVLFSISSSAQSRRSSYGLKNNGNSCPKFYLGMSTGINNHSGFLGLNIDLPAVDWFSVSAGAGLSSWGFKVYGEGRFYFSPCNRGWALGAGLSTNTGIKNFTTTLPTIYGDRNVLMDLNSLTNVFVSGYRFWNMGKSGHRFDLRLGYSACITPDQYTIKSGDVLTSDGEAVMDVLSPGGIIIGIGFTFALAR